MRLSLLIRLSVVAFAATVYSGIAGCGKAEGSDKPQTPAQRQQRLEKKGD